MDVTCVALDLARGGVRLPPLEQVWLIQIMDPLAILNISLTPPPPPRKKNSRFVHTI